MSYKQALIGLSALTATEIGCAGPLEVSNKPVAPIETGNKTYTEIVKNREAVAQAIANNRQTEPYNMASANIVGIADQGGKHGSRGGIQLEAGTVIPIPGKENIIVTSGGQLELASSNFEAGKALSTFIGAGVQTPKWSLTSKFGSGVNFLTTQEPFGGAQQEMTYGFARYGLDFRLHTNGPLGKLWDGVMSPFNFIQFSAFAQTPLTNRQIAPNELGGTMGIGGGF